MLKVIIMLKVSTIDESVGRIIKTLKANGLYKNTLIGENLEITVTFVYCDVAYVIIMMF